MHLQGNQTRILIWWVVLKILEVNLDKTSWKALWLSCSCWDMPSLDRPCLVTLCSELLDYNSVQKGTKILDKSSNLVGVCEPQECWGPTAELESASLQHCYQESLMWCSCCPMSPMFLAKNLLTASLWPPWDPPLGQIYLKPPDLKKYSWLAISDMLHSFWKLCHYFQ